MAIKVKVVKRDDSRDKRITREKSEREKLYDEKSRLMHRVKQIDRELQTA